jgi:L-lactate dehydrogenase complex protein LldF
MAPSMRRRLRSQVRQMKEHVLRNLPDLLEQLEDQADGQRRTGALGEGAATSTASSSRLRARPTCRRWSRPSRWSPRKCISTMRWAAGMKVVETDLGEYIIQLAGEPPSHIVAPVIHRRVEEISDIVPARTGHAAHARPAGDLQRGARRLRKEFLSADMGVSGCNFAIAETGTICIVTNEGNGRMSSTLPRVYVVVMGIEKLVPTVEDAFLQYQALCRSATGQQCSVYLSMTSGPAQAGDADGPEEFHVSCSTTGASTCWLKATARRSAASAAARVSTSAPSTGRSAATPTAAPTAARSAR